MTWYTASVFNPIFCLSVVLSGGFSSFQQASEFDELKHESELAALIPSALLHQGWKSNKFSLFAFNGTSCQLRRGCRLPALLLEFRRNAFPLRCSTASEPDCLCLGHQKLWLTFCGTCHRGWEPVGSSGSLVVFLGTLLVGIWGLSTITSWEGAPSIRIIRVTSRESKTEQQQSIMGSKWRHVWYMTSAFTVLSFALMPSALPAERRQDWWRSSKDLQADCPRQLWWR